jgi:hypothetical protein
MAPRLRLLLLLTACPLGACANAAEEEARALRLAFEGGRASLAAVALSPDAPAAVPRAHPAMLIADAPGAHPAAATQLLGLEPEMLRRWLGEPSLRRPEGSAEIWLYAGAACALDLILYPEDGRLRVAEASARAKGAELRTEAHCLRELAAGPAPQPLPAAADRGV